MYDVSEKYLFYNPSNNGNVRVKQKVNFKSNDKNQTEEQKSDSLKNIDSEILLRTLDAISSYSQIIVNEVVNKLPDSSFFDAKNYTLSTESLKAGSKYLAKEGTPEYQAIYDLVKDTFICIPDKETATKIMQKQYNSMNINSKNNVYVLDPANQKLRELKHIGTSNAYMSRWYKDINNIKNDIITECNIRSVIDKSESDEIIIIVPDDCAITGRSMIMNTINTLNSIEIPKDKKIKLILSPMISTKKSEEAFIALSKYDMNALKNTKIFNENGKDFVAIDKFFNKSNQIEIQHIGEKVEAKPYYESEYFKKLNQELASKVRSIITYKESANGFGREGISGVMIATPKEVVDKNGNISYPLRCPNNNVYGAAPYALAQGATPTTVKQPSNKLGNEKFSTAKWQFFLQGMQQKIMELMKQE